MHIIVSLGCPASGTVGRLLRQDDDPPIRFCGVGDAIPPDSTYIFDDPDVTALTILRQNGRDTGAGRIPVVALDTWIVIAVPIDLPADIEDQLQSLNATLFDEHVRKHPEPFTIPRFLDGMYRV